MDTIFSLEQLDQAAAQFLQQTQGKKVFAFHGEMGAGKTTFITAVCRQLGVTQAMSSPTFSIINSYEIPANGCIYHIDLYRIKDEEEALQAGVEDCLFSGHYCFVEWPQKAPGLFPPHVLHCYLSLAPQNNRKLQIKL